MQIGCRLQSRGHCILNKLHKCPAICCLPPYHPVNVQMLKCWLLLSAFRFPWLSLHVQFVVLCIVQFVFYLFSFFQMYTYKKKGGLGLSRKTRKLEVFETDSCVKLRVACTTVTVKGLVKPLKGSCRQIKS